jgi:hypothetical protein
MAQRGKFVHLHGYTAIRVSTLLQVLSPKFILPSLKQDSQTSIFALILNSATCHDDANIVILLHLKKFYGVS